MFISINPLQAFPPYSIPIDVNSEDQNHIETKFIVLAWDKHNLITLLCKAWDQHTFRQSFSMHRTVSDYFEIKAVVAVPCIA